MSTVQAISVPGLLALLAVAMPRPVAAQDALRTLSLRAEAGVVGTLPQYQQDDLEYGLGMMGALRPGWRPFAPLVVQLALESYYFPSDGTVRSPSAQPGAGQQYTLGAGIRLEPRLGSFGWVFLDGNAGLALTGDLERFTFDAGLGLEIALGRALGVGPFVRYMHTFANADDDYPSDAQFVIVGLSIALRGREREEEPPDEALAPRDQDADGVLDRDDLCPTIPKGDHPDPTRRGCPAADTDADGIFDHDDRCPTVPMGAHPDPARLGCPETDRDLDGVYDSSDVCPDVPMGLHPDPARPGCPLPDRDRDSIPEPPDACPDQPGAPTTDPRTNGCPGLVRVEEGQIQILRPVFFATNRDRILSRSRPVLQAVADALSASPQIRRIRVEGHTDDVADDAYNLELSQRRANSVMAFLIQAGVPPVRLEAVGYGETRPLIREESSQARAVNRRVEFHIVDGENAEQLTPPGTLAAGGDQ